MTNIWIYLVKSNIWHICFICFATYDSYVLRKKHMKHMTDMLWGRKKSQTYENDRFICLSYVCKHMTHMFWERKHMTVIWNIWLICFEKDKITNIWKRLNIWLICMNMTHKHMKMVVVSRTYESYVLDREHTKIWKPLFHDMFQNIRKCGRINFRTKTNVPIFYCPNKNTVRTFCMYYLGNYVQLG